MAFLDSVLAAETVPDAAATAGDQLGWLTSSSGQLDRSVVASAESLVSSGDASVLTRDDGGRWSLQVGDAAWSAGRFETPTLLELRRRCEEETGLGTGGLTFSVLDGRSPLTDIGGLQAAAPSGALFQVASQFNCLEAPGPYLVPVSRYFGDPTQGPRAAISTFPATLVRHYRAPTPGGGWFTQESRGRQVELLASACGEGVAPFGYLTGHGVEAPGDLADRLEAEWARIRVGAHWDIDVVRGYDWDGAVEPEASSIALVTTSTAAGGYYGADRFLGPIFFERVTRSLLTAAYFGTLLAAAAAKRQWVVLTLIGGGAFGNPISWVLESLVWALGEVEGLLQTDLHVVLNGRDLSDRVDLESVVLPAVRRWSGRICQFSDHGLEAVLS